MGKRRRKKRRMGRMKRSEGRRSWEKGGEEVEKVSSSFLFIRQH